MSFCSLSSSLLRWCPLRSTLFPYTTLFRSHLAGVEQPLAVHDHVADAAGRADQLGDDHVGPCPAEHQAQGFGDLDRKSTRLNSSHTVISYAVFCLKKKNQNSLKDIATCLAL